MILDEIKFTFRLVFLNIVTSLKATCIACYSSKEGLNIACTVNQIILNF